MASKQNYEENFSEDFYFKKYGIQTKPDGRFSLYTTKSGEDFVSKSEDEKVKAYLQAAKSKLTLKKNSLMPPVQLRPCSIPKSHVLL